VQLENALMKEGFRPDELKACNILREAQSLDDKRPDFLIYHGFLVPVVIETKLLKHGDLSEPMETKESYASLKRYMSDYSAVRAILFVIDNKSVPKATFDRKLKRINKAYSKINGVTVISVQIPEA
jgi:hypothetical protein